MMTLLFERGNEKALVIINGNDVKFGNSSFGNYVASIEGLFINREGVIKEFPNLKNDENWKKKATERFKDKIKSLNGEKEISDFIIEELREMGYVPLAKQKGGFRIEKIKQ